MKRNTKFAPINSNSNTMKISKPTIAVVKVMKNNHKEAKDPFVCTVVEVRENLSDFRALYAQKQLNWAMKLWNSSVSFPSRNEFPDLYADILDICRGTTEEEPLSLKDGSFATFKSTIVSCINKYRYNSQHYSRMIYLKDDAGYQEGQLVKIQYTVVEGRYKGFGSFYSSVTEADLTDRLYMTHRGEWVYEVKVADYGKVKGFSLLKVEIPRSGFNHEQEMSLGNLCAKFGLQSNEEMALEMEGKLPANYSLPLGAVLTRKVFMAEEQISKVVGEGEVSEDGLYVNGCASEAVIYIIENLEKGLSTSNAQFGMLKLQAMVEKELLTGDNLFHYLDDMGGWCDQFVTKMGINTVHNGIIYSEKA